MSKPEVDQQEKASLKPRPVKKGISVASPLVQIKELEQDPELIRLCAEYLPPNYDFEIAKTVWRIRKIPDCKVVALQMPEGLLIFATKIGEVLREMTGVDTILMGDVTYGACCVDDFTAHMLGAQLLVHYGHSCLVPTTVANRIDTIYVFVTIKFSVEHAVESIRSLVLTKAKEKRKHLKIVSDEGNDSASGHSQNVFNLSLVSTIQFANSLATIKQDLERENELAEQGSNVKIVVNIPRSKPLSSGEILGCTAPKVSDELIVYVGDGRFHLEAMMMANPGTEAYRYDPYNKTMTEELFDHKALNMSRGSAVKPLLQSSTENKRLKIGIILGTLGRQGNPKPMNHVYDALSARHDCFVVLMSEVVPAKLALFEDVDLWVLFACPRLSIDWGNAFPVPLLTPFEAMWANNLEMRQHKHLSCDCGDIANSNICNSSSDCEKNVTVNNFNGHPMDYYAYDSLGPHTPNFVLPKPKPSRVK